MNKNFKLDFIGIGAEKAGTTWVADMLKQHHLIYIPKQKELHYFNRKFVENPKLNNYNFDKPFSWYEKFFKNSKPNQIKGELSPTYLWDKEAPKKINKYFPNVKLFVVLRNPTERSLSQYYYYKHKGLIMEKTFYQALRNYPFLLERSMYYKQLKKYFDLFPKENIKIMFFEDLKNDKISFLKELEDFLGVKRYVPNSIDKKSNVTGLPKYKNPNIILAKIRFILRKYKLNFILDLARKIGLAQYLEKIRNTTTDNKFSKEKIDEKTRKYLKEYFSEDIEKLEKLIKKDLSAWKQ